VTLERLEALEEIRRLKALYCRYSDRGYEGAGDDPVAFAALFVPDAVWQGGRGEPVVGRKAIEERFVTWRSFGFHFVSNPIVDVDLDAGRASARWSAIAPATGDDGVALWIAGTYDDIVVRTAEGWLFERVRFRTAFRTPYADGWAKTRFVDG